MNADLWAQVREVGERVGVIATWPLVRRDVMGWTFAKVIYACLGLPAARARAVREAVPFQHQWQTAAAMGFGDDVLLMLCEKGIGKALALREQRNRAAWRKTTDREPRWGAIWISDWKRRISGWVRDRSAGGALR